MSDRELMWDKPAFKGLSVLGDVALTGTSAVFSEADLCDLAGCEPEGLEDWLARYWREHDIHAVMEGSEAPGPHSMLLKRQTGFKKRVLGEVREHVLWRMFSPSATALREWSPEVVDGYCSVRPRAVRPVAGAKSAKPRRRSTTARRSEDAAIR